MRDFSVLIGGKAGFGIDKSGLIIGRLLNRLGFRVYIYRDYPSLIRGGHTFSITRASDNRIAAHKSQVDFILALNQDTLNLHRQRLAAGSVVIYDSDSVKPESLPEGVKASGIPIGGIIKEEAASEIMRNTCIIGAFSKAAGIQFNTLAEVLGVEIAKELELNLKLARRGYDFMPELLRITAPKQESLSLLSGNQAIGLGLIKGGLKTYIAYPMTPSSPILHFLAEVAKDFNLKVIHPESEIGVILMALGFSYMGEKTAIGTSGGGFCLMTEALSFAGMGELPIVIVVGQRPGPSTGLPTYSCQTELHFVLNAGQGEFPRFIVAPGDAEEAYFWSAVSLNLSWKYQLPSIILSDKNLGEAALNFDIGSIAAIDGGQPALWDRKTPYKRYAQTQSGVSPFAFVPDKDAIVKVNSYEHDEYGITTEDPLLTKSMQDKRLRKEAYLQEELEKFETVKAYGKGDSSTALLCWGSNKGVCVEAAAELGLKVIQPLVLNPFPVKQFKQAVSGFKRIICVESNATSQLARLIKCHGFEVQDKVLKYDGRPFTLDELKTRITEVLNGS